MATPGKVRLRLVTVIYWMLLIYVISALVWWFISLEQQNREMSELQHRVLLNEQKDIPTNQFNERASRIDEDARRNTRKYVAEGITFLILILIGAAFVYRYVRRQFKLQQQQQNFMMAVTHELKTPISVATLSLETLQKYHLDPEKQKKIIQAALAETSRLNTLTNNILVASQMEADGYVFSREELDLSDLFRDCIVAFRTRYPERRFLEEIEPEIAIEGDPLLLQMMINNLIENAIKYSPKEKPVTCRLTRVNQKIVVNIIDEGEGIADEEKKKIFGKFYRVGNELTRRTQGTGLGLYLCRKIASDHGADIVVTNNKPRGSNFAIIFTSNT